jgi:hypothetical protein
VQDLSISQRIAQVRQTLPETVRLVAVTKKVSVAAIRQAYAAGIRDFGESRVQEAIPKQDELQDLPDITWHFIGHLQTNKAKAALERFDWIHSVDRLKLARSLHREIQKGAPSPQLCLQVKVFRDPDKYGWHPGELLDALDEIDKLEELDVRGLMTIAPMGLNESETLTLFRRVRELAEQIDRQGRSRIQMQQLSMGMSQDYPLAVQAGATIVRLGRVLFGEREP